jgi:hypothetical protein
MKTCSQKTPSWVLGTILGDAYVDPTGRLCIEHSIRQEEYFLCKFHKLQSMGVLPAGSIPKRRKLKPHKISGKCYETYYIRSKPVFLHEREYFYFSGSKEVPTNLCDRFDAEALAFWFMDDGGRNSSKGSGLVLDVSGFSLESQHLLKDILDSNFGLETTFHICS